MCLVLCALHPAFEKAPEPDRRGEWWDGMEHKAANLKRDHKVRFAVCWENLVHRDTHTHVHSC